MLALPILATAPEEGRAQGALVLEEVWASTGSPTLGEWLAVNGMAEDEQGNIWVSNGRLGQIVGIRPDGAFFQVARQGDGPGEVQGPGRIARRPKGGMAVMDDARFTIELFDGSGTFERRVIPRQQVWGLKGIAVLPNGDVLLSGFAITSGHTLVEVDVETGAVDRGWRPLQGDVTDERAERNVMGGALAMANDGAFLLSLSSPLRILSYSAPGAPPLVLHEDEARVPFIGDAMIVEPSAAGQPYRYRWDYPRTTGVFRRPDGTILNVVTMRETSESLWQILSPSGDLIAEETVPIPYNAWALTRSGDVLASRFPLDALEEHAVRLRVDIR